MTIYCDTSVILARHIPEDNNAARARKLYATYDGHDFLWCDLQDVEAPLTIRALTRRETDGLDESIARAGLHRLERALGRGFYQRRALPAESVARAKSLSGAYGWQRKHTAFDVWHVAAALVLGVNRFITFDDRQAALAEEAGLILG